MRSDLLENKIQESGLKLGAICERSGISRYSLRNKLNGETEFKATEIVALSQILGLTAAERDQIFLQ